MIWIFFYCIRTILTRENKSKETKVKKMTPREEMIVRVLRKEGFISIASLQRKTGLKAPTLYGAKQALWKKGFIKKGTVLLDFKKLGYALHLLFYIETEQEIIPFLKAQCCINTLFLIDIPKAYFFEAVFTSGEELNQFITMTEEYIELKKINFWGIKDEILRENAFVES